MPPVASWKTYAELFLFLADKIKIPAAPWLVFGSPTADELAEFLAQSPFSDKMLEDGVLFVPQVYEATTFHGYAHGLAIEGIGDTPEHAVLNFMVGADRNELSSLSQEADKFFSATFPKLDSAEYRRAPDRDRGFFIKRRPDGRFVVGTDTVDIGMAELRSRATVKFISLSYLSNATYRTEIAQLRAAQQEYLQIFEQFSSRFQEAALGSKLSEAINLQKQAISDVDRAQRAYEEAAKIANSAQGIAFLAGLLSLAGSAAGYFSSVEGSTKTAAATSQAQSAWAQRTVREREYINRHNTLYELTIDVQETLREVLPNVPLPPLPKPPTLLEGRKP